MNDDIYNYVFTAMVESDQILVINGVKYVYDKESDSFRFLDKSLKSKCDKYNSTNIFKRLLGR